jgi:hypothetical protein
MIKSDYIGDDLIIQRLRVLERAVGNYELPEHFISVIPAPDRDPVNSRPAIPDLNCRYLCNCYYSVISDNTIERISTVYHSQQKKGPVRFEDSKDQLALTFDLEHFEKEWQLVGTALDSQ